MERDTKSVALEPSLNQQFQQWFPDSCMQLTHYDSQTKSRDDNFQIPAKAKHTRTKYFSCYASFVGWAQSVLCCLHPRAQAETSGPFRKLLVLWQQKTHAGRPHNGSEHFSEICTHHSYSHSICRSKSLMAKPY